MQHTADTINRIDDALDAYAIPRSRDLEAFEEWLDSFNDEVDMTESREVR